MEGTASGCHVSVHLLVDKRYSNNDWSVQILIIIKRLKQDKTMGKNEYVQKKTRNNVK